ncbi:MAG: radical SAM protein, partial [Candidatus Aenigmatarchaeota archaeon]
MSIAGSLIASILKSRFISHSPIMLTHLVTSLCNARCKTCDLWKKSSGHKNDMSKEDIFKMLEKARKAGMGGYTAWGGEPLLRKDLPEILRFAKKNKLITTVITNGFSLKERCDEIAPFTDYLIVSIDSNDELHDKMRGVKGIRKRAIDGIIACKKTRMKTVINSVISNLNMDRIDGLFELS